MSNPKLKWLRCNQVLPSAISALRWPFLARQGRVLNAMCRFNFLQILAAILLCPGNKNMDNESVEKLVFMKQLCEAGSRKDQCCGI